MKTLKGGRVATQIPKYRRRRQMSIRDVVRLLDFESNKAYWEWEVGERTPSLANALRLSFVLRCPVEVLFFDLYDRLRKELREREQRFLLNDGREQSTLF